MRLPKKSKGLSGSSSKAQQVSIHATSEEIKSLRAIAVLKELVKFPFMRLPKKSKGVLAPEMFLVRPVSIHATSEEIKRIWSSSFRKLSTSPRFPFMRLPKKSKGVLSWFRRVHASFHSCDFRRNQKNFGFPKSTYRYNWVSIHATSEEIKSTPESQGISEIQHCVSIHATSEEIKSNLSTTLTCSHLWFPFMRLPKKSKADHISCTTQPPVGFHSCDFRRNQKDSRFSSCAFHRRFPFMWLPKKSKEPARRTRSMTRA